MPRASSRIGLAVLKDAFTSSDLLCLMKHPGTPALGGTVASNDDLEQCRVLAARASEELRGQKDNFVVQQSPTGFSFFWLSCA